MKRKPKYQLSNIGVFLVIWLVINLVQAYFTPLHYDEAYYFMYSKKLDWGYFDHPPMIALFIKIGYSIFQNELGVRLLTVFASTFTLYIIYDLALQNNKISIDKYRFILLIISSVVLNMYSFITTPDVPFLFFGTLFLWLFQNLTPTRVAPNPSPQERGIIYTLFTVEGWSEILISLIAACVLYSKYHGILLFAFVVAANPFLLKQARFYRIVFFTFLFFLPHLYWQYSHQFPSVMYHLKGRHQQHEWIGRYVWEYPLNQWVMFSPLVAFYIFKSVVLETKKWLRQAQPDNATVPPSLSRGFGKWLRQAQPDNVSVIPSLSRVFSNWLRQALPDNATVPPSLSRGFGKRLRQAQPDNATVPPSWSRGFRNWLRQAQPDNVSVTPSLSREFSNWLRQAQPDNDSVTPNLSRGNRTYLFIFWGFLGFFFLMTFKGHVEPHWTAMAIVLGIVLMLTSPPTPLHRRGGIFNRLVLHRRGGISNRLVLHRRGGISNRLVLHRRGGIFNRLVLHRRGGIFNRLVLQRRRGISNRLVLHRKRGIVSRSVLHRRGGISNRLVLHRRGGIFKSFVLHRRDIGRKQFRSELNSSLFIISFLLLLSIRIGLIFNFFPQTGISDQTDWIKTIEKAANGKNVVFVDSYKKASLFSFYAHTEATTIHSAKKRSSQFEIWNKTSETTFKNAYFVAEDPNLLEKPVRINNKEFGALKINKMALFSKGL